MLAARGLAIFAAGLFKKVVIADNLAQFVSPVFAHLDAGGGVTTPWAWLATLAYTLANLFRFLRLFRHGGRARAVVRHPAAGEFPLALQAASIIEFWRRWHITLSRFLRDYLYIPLGGNRLGEQRRYINLMVTMLLGGLWHGAGWNFLVWGGLHGVYLGINHLWREWRGGDKPAAATGSPAKGLAVKGLSWAITFFAVVIAWVFFRARTMAGAWQMLGGLFGFGAGSSAYASPGILRLMDLPRSGGRAAIAADRRRRGCAGAGDRVFPTQRSATVRLSRISPRAGAAELAALAAERVHGRWLRRLRWRSRCSACGSGLNFCIFSSEA